MKIIMNDDSIVFYTSMESNKSMLMHTAASMRITFRQDSKSKLIVFASGENADKFMEAIGDL